MTRKAEVKSSLPPIDINHVIKIISDFIKTRVEESKRSGIVVGLSGGIDSTVVVSLCVKALGSDRVHGVFFPSSTTPPSDYKDVEQLCKSLNISLTVVDIQKLIDVFSSTIKTPEDSRLMEWANLKPRLRQTVWYYYANKLNCLICGGGNKSEIMIGYFTKYGDAAVDLLPLGDIYKTQIYQLGRALKIPEKILNKAPSAGLWKDQTDEEEIGMTYVELDQILYGLERFQTDEEIVNKLNVPLSQVKKVKSLIYRSEHKRRGPIIFKMGIRTPTIDWRIPLVEPGEY
ncbi:NAD+ synthase [Candidatus Hodarchaeum mangrovi]